jgi:hypothetical protein
MEGRARGEAERELVVAGASLTRDEWKALYGRGTPDAQRRGQPPPINGYDWTYCTDCHRSLKLCVHNPFTLLSPEVMAMRLAAERANNERRYAAYLKRHPTARERPAADERRPSSPAPTPGPRSDPHALRGSRALSPDAVDAVVAAYDNGYGARIAELAATYGVPSALVSEALRSRGITIKRGARPKPGAPEEEAAPARRVASRRTGRASAGRPAAKKTPAKRAAAAKKAVPAKQATTKRPSARPVRKKAAKAKPARRRKSSSR